MTKQSRIITNGFLIAGMANMTVLFFSRCFTNPVIPEADPVVMSNFGLLMIVVWGLAYMSIAKNYHQVKWLVLIFAIEKFIYGFIWTKWILNNDVSNLFAKDIMAGTFYSIYGINDWIFCGFFLYVFIRLSKFGDK